MSALYENINDKIGTGIPQIQATLNDLVVKNNDFDNLNADTNEYDIKEYIIKFMNAIDPKTKSSIKKAYIYIDKETKNNPIGMNTIMQYLLSEGIDSDTAILSTGIIWGITCTGVLSYRITVSELIEQL